VSPMQGKNHQNIAISTNFLHFAGAHVLMQAKFGNRQLTDSLRLRICAKFHLIPNPFIVSPSRDEKPQFLTNLDSQVLLY